MKRLFILTNEIIMILWLFKLCYLSTIFEKIKDLNLSPQRKNSSSGLRPELFSSVFLSQELSRSIFGAPKHLLIGCPLPRFVPVVPSIIVFIVLSSGNL